MFHAGVSIAVITNLSLFSFHIVHWVVSSASTTHPAVAAATVSTHSGYQMELAAVNNPDFNDLVISFINSALISVTQWAINSISGFQFTHPLPQHDLAS